MGIVINNPAANGAVDLTAPSTPIGSVAPVAVTSTIFTASPANNTSGYASNASSLTGANAQSLVNLSQIWNTTGTPTLIQANVTDTASNANSLLLDLRTSGVSRFRIAKNGDFTSPLIASELANNRCVVIGTLLGNAGSWELGNNGAATILSLNSSGIISWSSGSNRVTTDLLLYRDAANTFAQRNGAVSQVSRLYKSFTDASNYTRSAWLFDANGLVLSGESAGTGDANIDITLGPKGTGRLRYGTHSVLATEVITGYIEIKDASGTLRKLAVIS